MHLPSVFSGPFRWLAPLLCMIACCGVAQAQMTTFSGTVYSPLGPPVTGSSAAHGDPIPNILVFAVNPAFPPPPFAQGVATPTGTQTGCEAQPTLVPSAVLGEGLTDAAGNFTFTTSGVIPNPLTIVIQAGKWRRQYSFPNIAAGSTNPLGSLSMPGSQGPGADLPHIAIVTGEADAIECIFNQIGIANTEITDPSGSGSINLYVGNSAGGVGVSSSTPGENVLVSSPSTLNNYDLVMFGCQGGTGDAAAPQYANNLTAYTSDGGRIFTTHFEYIWLEDNTSFSDVATWGGTYSASATTLSPSTVVTNYPEGEILSTWLNNIGALVSDNPPTVDLTNVRVNTTALANPPAQSWVNLNSATSQGLSANSFSGTPSMQFTFDTPLGAQGSPSVVVQFVNSTTTFAQGDKADTVTINVSNSPTASATSPGLTLTLSLPGGLTATSLAGVGNTGWVCNQNTLVCTEPNALASGASDSVALTFSISPTALGQESLGAALSGGGLSSGSQQCGRVLFNDYHVEPPRSTPKAGALYANGAYCPAQTGLSNVQKFLEFSLYNLSNFVSPSTTDLIEIQGPTKIVWPQPAAISYGTALSNMQLDATATDPESNVTMLPGTFAYTPPVGTVLPVNSPCNPGNLSVAFTPTDSVDYESATGTTCLSITPDATTTTLITASGSTTPGVVTPIYYGQIIGDTAIMGVTSKNPGVGIDGGNLAFYIVPNGMSIGSVPPSCNIPITVMDCPASTGVGYDAGTYQVYSAYSGDTNFAASQTQVFTVMVQPDPTMTTLMPSTNTSPPGQTITFTANVADQYYSPVVGNVIFYNGTTMLATVPVNASSAAVYSTAALPIGVHSITACYVPALDKSGTYDFKSGCSPAIPETISLPGTVNTTSTTLTSSLNPSVVGQTVTFSATAATTGSFISTPAGTVTFYDGPNQIGSGILNNGVATLAISTLAAGQHNITADYLGSSTMAPSTSAILAQQVNVGIGSAGEGFLMTVSPTTFSVGAGSSVSVAVTILDLNNFNLPVTLGCSGLPAEATCTFSTPTIVAPGGTTPLTITVNAPHACGSNTPYFVAGSGSTMLPILATVVFAFFARRRRILKGIALAAILCLLPAINGCGGNCTDLGVKPGTYTFTVTGTTGGAVPVTVAVPAGGASTIPGTSQSQTMIMTVTI